MNLSFAPSLRLALASALLALGAVLLAAGPAAAFEPLAAPSAGAECATSVATAELHLGVRPVRPRRAARRARKAARRSARRAAHRTARRVTRRRTVVLL